MYFIVENIEQLSQMSPSDSCFIQAIPLNDSYHPNLTSLSLVYYNDFKKGYIFVVDHSEGFSLDKKLVESYINQHKKVYVLDKKYHSYFLDLKSCIDLHFVSMNQTGKYEPFDCDTLLHRGFFQNSAQDPELNKYIPISKHYEKCECLMNKLNNFVGLESDTEIEDRFTNAYKSVEKNGIAIDVSLLRQNYQPQYEGYSIKDSLIFGYYNMYNVTGRPTNSFNAVNFLAIPKDKKFRECFLAKNDVLVEFDFDAYHLRLIAKLVGYQCPKESMHNVLGRQYFDKQDLDEEDYKKSKQITFKQLYGGLDEKYKHIEFFSLLDSFIDKEWKKYNKFGAIVLPTGRLIKKSDNLNKLQLFNYIVQNLETKQNIEKIEKINEFLQDKKTQLILITYDSFLFDFSLEDGKECLNSLRDILQEGDMLVKHKYGKDYSF
jgi:hypothetical protein